jgi:streptomycin 6-kinase
VIVVPDQFAAGIAVREGAAGRVWLAALPSIVADLCHRWKLIVEGPPWHGHLAIVVPVRRGTEPHALKLSWRDTETVHESRALTIWNGSGTVRLLESSPDHGAMLLERLDAQRTLFDLPLDRAMSIAGEIIRRLSIPGDATLPTVASLAERIATTLADRWERLQRPIPEPLLRQAIELAIALPDPSAQSMVNWDLHHSNVLYSPSRREWLAIDPKPATGAPEFGIAQLLWTRIDEMSSPADLNRHLATLIDAAGLDAGLTRAWTFVRVVDYWLWALSIGLTEDPRRCATLIEWLKG